MVAMPWKNQGNVPKLLAQELVLCKKASREGLNSELSKLGAEAASGRRPWARWAAGGKRTPSHAAGDSLSGLLLGRRESPGCCGPGKDPQREPGKFLCWARAR